MVQVPNLSEWREIISRPWLLSREAFVEHRGIPVMAKGRLLGILEVFQRSPSERTTEWMTFFQTLSGQCAIAIDNILMLRNLRGANRDLEHAYDETLEGWVQALDLRDKDTQGHSLRVTELTLRVAQAMDIHGEQLVAARRGALLHDIGKLGVPDSILHKPGALTDEEYEVMKLHPDYAFRWLWQISYLRSSVPIPYCHHERWDGSGYPRGLSGTEIPLEARIFAVADAWDAMTNDRPYRKPLSAETAMGELEKGAGTQFDPEVVSTFLQVVQGQQETGERSGE